MSAAIGRAVPRAFALSTRLLRPGMPAVPPLGAYRGLCATRHASGTNLPLGPFRQQFLSIRTANPCLSTLWRQPCAARTPVSPFSTARSPPAARAAPAPPPRTVETRTSSQASEEPGFELIYECTPGVRLQRWYAVAMAVAGPLIWLYVSAEYPVESTFISFLIMTLAATGTGLITWLISRREVYRLYLGPSPARSKQHALRPDTPVVVYRLTMVPNRFRRYALRLDDLQFEPNWIFYNWGCRPASGIRTPLGTRQRFHVDKVELERRGYVRVWDTIKERTEPGVRGGIMRRWTRD